MNIVIEEFLDMVLGNWEDFNDGGLNENEILLKNGVWNIIENGTNKIMCMRALLEFIFIFFFRSLSLPWAVPHYYCWVIYICNQLFSTLLLHGISYESEKKEEIARRRWKNHQTVTPRRKKSREIRVWVRANQTILPRYAT